ncbi:MAG: hypothetical protein M3R17_11540 [Bacteroidota bacterium]|nr:hypothetical protein [Bacteroidota bacterium]
MTTFSIIESSGFLHWTVALMGILSFLFVQVARVKDFSIKTWVNENLIAFMWSLFFLSLIVTLTHEFFASYQIHEALLTGYVGAHLVFSFTKEQKHKTNYNLKHPHKN